MSSKEEIINEEIEKLLHDPQKLKTIIEKNKEYTQTLLKFKEDVSKRIKELEELKQRKLELLASL